jgi:hypothetical protein
MGAKPFISISEFGPATHEVNRHDRSVQKRETARLHHLFGTLKAARVQPSFCRRCSRKPTARIVSALSSEHT